MNIYTKSDVKKFIRLLNIGLKNGTGNELKIWTHGITYDGTTIPKEYYISLEFRGTIQADKIQSIIEEDILDSDIDELMNDLNA